MPEPPASPRAARTRIPPRGGGAPFLVPLPEPGGRGTLPRAARFPGGLVGRARAGQEPAPDGSEAVSCRWFTPRGALDAYLAGTITLIPPTVRTLDDLARFPSVDAVLADASRRVVRAVTPELVNDGVR